MLLHLPTLTTVRQLAYAHHSYVIVRKNHAFNRYIGLLYSSKGRLLFNGSHQSEQQIVKILLCQVLKRANAMDARQP